MIPDSLIVMIASGTVSRSNAAELRVRGSHFCGLLFGEIVNDPHEDFLVAAGTFADERYIGNVEWSLRLPTTSRRCR